MIAHVLPSASGETRRTSVKRLMRPTGASTHGLLQFLEVELAELRHLGRDHQAAVALVRFAAVVGAGGFLRGVETPERGGPRHDRGVPQPRPPPLLCYPPRGGAPPRRGGGE